MTRWLSDQAQEKSFWKCSTFVLAVQSLKLLRNFAIASAFLSSTQLALLLGRLVLTFSIVDRQDYGEIFVGQLTLLNLSLEEVHSLKYLLHELDLADRYMSTTLQEDTRTTDGRLQKRLTTNLRNKAYAVARLVVSPVHFGVE